MTPCNDSVHIDEMIPRKDKVSTQRHVALAAACRIARRIVNNGGNRSEALQFLANASVRYFSAATTIVIVSEHEEALHLVTPAGMPEDLIHRFNGFPVYAAGFNDSGVFEIYLSVPVFSADRKVIATINLHGSNSNMESLDDAVGLEILAQGVAQIFG